MSITAMKQALEAFEAYQYNGSVQLFDEAVTSLRQAIQEEALRNVARLGQEIEQEPVAVILEDMKGGGYIEWLDDTYYVPGTKFYTQPQQAEKQEPVAWMNPHGGFLSASYIDKFASGLDKEIHNIPLYTSPPQREFVGLTDEERNHARHTVTYSQLAMTAGEWAEAVQIETEKRLKEKNT
jgi:hypothetical protein